MLSIHDVRDVEGYAAVILMDSLRRFGARLNEHDRESLHAYLIALIWELGAKWDRRGSFAQYAGSIAGLRVVDWFRSERGDQRFEKWHAEVIVDSDAVARVDLADEDDVCELAVANAFQLPRCALSPRASETLEVIERGIAVSWTDRTMLRRRLHLRDELAALDVSSELVR